MTASLFIICHVPPGFTSVNAATRKQTGNQTGDLCFVSSYASDIHFMYLFHKGAFSLSLPRPKTLRDFESLTSPYTSATLFPPQKINADEKRAKIPGAVFTQCADGGPTGKRWSCCSVIQGLLGEGKKRL